MIAVAWSGYVSWLPQRLLDAAYFITLASARQCRLVACFQTCPVSCWDLHRLQFMIRMHPAAYRGDLSAGNHFSVLGKLKAIRDRLAAEFDDAHGHIHHILKRHGPHKVAGC